MLVALQPIESAAPSHTITLDVGGMKCAGCIRSVEKALTQQPGVQEAIVNLVTEVATVTADPRIKPETLAQALTAAGFPSQPRYPEGGSESIQAGLLTLEERRQLEAQHQRQQLMIATALLITSSLGHLTHALGITVPAFSNDWFHGSLAAATLMVPGRPILVEGWQGLRRNAPNMNTLIGLGAFTAFATSLVALLFPNLGWECFFDEPVMLIGFILLGRSLEQKARHRAAAALQSLVALQPKTAHVVGKDGDRASLPIGSATGTAIDIPIDLVRVGEWVQVLPSEQMPVDGEILQGSSAIDEAMLTGESVPVLKAVGDLVSAGTFNQSGALILRVTRVGQDTTLARIIHLVEAAQTRKAPIQKLADTVAGYFTYGVMAIATLTGLFWYFVGTQLWPQVLEAAPHAMSHMAMPLAAHSSSPLLLSLKLTIAVLVIACPCALGLATPMALLVGSGIGAERGLLIRGADVLERAHQLDTIVFDKTGTLTAGSPTVTAVFLAPGSPPQATHLLLRIAATVESGTRHPLAKAIIQAAQREGLPLLNATDFQTLPGLGVAARVQLGQAYSQTRLGTLDWFAQLKIPIDHLVAIQAQALAAAGKTVVAVALEQELIGLLAIEDPIRVDAAGTIQALQSQGLRVKLLTGDRIETATYLAEILGIAPQDVMAQVPPEGKATAIAQLQAAGHRVGMVGDGINDAPALAKADVGIALQSGTEVATETAGIVLVADRLTSVTAALDLSRATFGKIRQNLWWAFGYNLLAIPAAAGVLLPVYHFTLTPAGAGLLMALSSISVATNSLLLRFQMGKSGARG